MVPPGPVIVIGALPAMLLAALAPAPAATQQRVQQLAPIVVTGSRLPTTLDRTPAATTVITRAEIEARRPASVTDLLRQVPGLHVDQPGGRGGVNSVYLRGGDPNFTLVLIDGVRVNDPINSRGGSYDFALLAPDQVERIEIVRGPLSAIYGSDAMSGVINIVTRKGNAEKRVEAEAALGRFGYNRAAAHAGGPIGEARFAVGASYVDEGEPVEGNAFVGRSLTASLSVPPSDSTLFETSLRFARADRESFPDDSGGPEFAVLRQRDMREDREAVLSARFSHQLRSWWDYDVRFGLFDRTGELSSPGVAPGRRDPFGIPASMTRDELRRYELTAASRFAIGDVVHLTLGAELQREHGSSEGTLQLPGMTVPTSFSLDRRIAAPFAELQVTPIESLLLQASIRWDLPDAFEDEVSPRLGASYRIAATGTTLRASWGEGFKLPSFFALGNPIVGNPSLTPETSRSFDLGLTQNLWDERASLSVTYFDSRFFDAVDFEEGPPPRLVNRSEIEARGVELALNLQARETLSFDASLSYTETDIAETVEELRNRPEWRGGVTASWRPRQDLRLGLAALHVGEVRDSSIPTGDVTLDPYLRLDLMVEWQPAPRWHLYLAVDNLLDADYEEVVGFPSRGVRPRIGARLTF